MGGDSEGTTSVTGHRRFHRPRTLCGRICFNRQKINISTVLAGQCVGIKEADDGIWIVSFMCYDLGYIDLEQRTLQPLDTPFGPTLLPMSYIRYVLSPMCPGWTPYDVATPAVVALWGGTRT